MVYCPHCGKELKILTILKFCSYCGTDLTSIAQKQITDTQLSQKKILVRPKPSYRPWLVVIAGIVSAGVIFIFIILTGLFFLGSLFGPPLGSGIEIHSDADFIEYSSSGVGSIDDPYILSNYTLVGQLYGFSIQKTTKHFIITNCTIEICYEGINIENIAPGTASILANTITYRDCRVWETGPHAGITILSSSGVNISNNIISSAGYEGIVIEESKNCYISNNTISRIDRGIVLEYSDSSIIKKNSFFDNYEAINCIGSHFVNITDNICINNEEIGINIMGSNFVKISNNICFNTTWFSWSSSGIVLDTCENCTVTNCTITDCYQGIYALSSSYCQIFYNRLENNSIYGITIFNGYKPAKSNTIYQNSFLHNNLGGISQGSDNGTSNFWYNSKLDQGNYWSDWNGTGSYFIAGKANTFDLYPLSDPPV